MSYEFKEYVNKVSGNKVQAMQFTGDNAVGILKMANACAKDWQVVLETADENSMVLAFNPPAGKEFISMIVNAPNPKMYIDKSDWLVNDDADDSLNKVSNTNYYDEYQLINKEVDSRIVNDKGELKTLKLEDSECKEYYITTLALEEHKSSNYAVRLTLEGRHFEIFNMSIENAEILHAWLGKRLGKRLGKE